MKYATSKKIRKIKDKIIKILISPLRWVCVPIYSQIEELRKKRRYSEKQIRKVVQYLIDYWTENTNEFFVILDDGYNPFDYSNIKTLYYMQSGMSWGWRGENKRIKNKASYIYFYQKEEYIKTFRDLCRNLLTLEEKKQYFNRYEVSKIKDRDVCKIK